MSSPCSAVRLRCEYQSAPLGIDEQKPRFSWQMKDSRKGARQSAYHIAVRKGDALVWDSGVVKSGDSIQMEYAGKKLLPRTEYSWQVCIADQEGGWSEWSEVAWFETGLMNTKTWSARWIEAVREETGSMHPSAYLRKEFALESNPIVRARLYATALGVYEARINGCRVGDAYFAPGWTKYEKRVQYQAYDVTAMVKAGANAIGVVLGDGWYTGTIGGAWVHGSEARYGERTRLRAQLVIDYADGTSLVIDTDDSWKFSTGPIVFSDIYMGEKYDARAELTGWDTAGYRDASWGATRMVTDPITVSAQAGPLVRAMKEIRPIAITQPQPGVWILNMGQNMVGWERLRVKGPAGTTVKVRHAEMLNPDGTMYTTNLRRAKATSEYVLKGAGEEVFEPHFTFFGFQYMELTGFPGTPELDSVTGVVLHSDMEQTGTFECSDSLINQLQHNIEWGQRGNYLDVPTDCPQRDERLGWTGDAQVFVRTAAHNFDIAGFFTKWFWDLNDSQSKDGKYPCVAPELPKGEPGGVTAWADAGVICPWTVYRCYGDTRVLERHFEGMRKWVDHQKNNSTDLIFSRSWFGDWLSINATTPGGLIGTAFFAYTARLVSKMATILGRTADAKKYLALSKKVTAAFNAEFVTPRGRLSGETQTAAILALHFELLPAAKRTKVVQWLVDDIKGRKDHLSCGFVGSPYINHVLTEGGRDDMAYALLHQTGWPSWLYAVTQGATTIWERWDGWTHDKGFQDAGMNSFNHYAYGAIGDWLYAKVAGLDLDPAVPAYKRFVVEPHPGGNLTHAKASLDSPYGRIVSGWRKQGKGLIVELTVPANTTALVRLPAVSAAKVRLDRKALSARTYAKVRGAKGGRVEVELGAGSYAFEVKA